MMHIKYLFFSLFLLINTAFANIARISNIDLIETVLQKSYPDTLVIFDVDRVLIMPTNEHTLNRHPYRQKLLRKLQAKLSKEEQKKLYGVTASMAEWRLVDPYILNIISYLEENHIPAIALTSLSTGKFGVIEKLEDWRIQQLKNFNIDFIRLSPIKDDISIKELEEDEGTPMLKSGIIFTAEIDKSKVLEHILRTKNYYPKTIIFIDDQLKNIEQVEKLAANLQIKFHGFHYTAVSKMPLPVIINKQTEKLRFQILEKNHRWLNYKELSHQIAGK